MTNVAAVDHYQDNNELKTSLLKWRDNVARFEDESLEYVLPLDLIDKIVESNPKLQSSNDLYLLSKEVLNDYVPQFLEENASLILEIIKQYQSLIEVDLPVVSKTMEVQIIKECLLSPPQ